MALSFVLALEETVLEPASPPTPLWWWVAVGVLAAVLFASAIALANWSDRELRKKIPGGNLLDEKKSQ